MLGVPVGVFQRTHPYVHTVVHLAAAETAVPTLFGLLGLPLVHQFAPAAVHLEPLEGGVYFLHVYGEERAYVARFVKAP